MARNGFGDGEAAGDRGMGDMDVRAGLQPDLEDLVVGHRLRQRRPGAAMHDGVRLPGGTGLRGQPLDQLLVLVMDGYGNAGRRDGGEGGHHGGVVDAGEANGVIFVGGQLERGDRRPLAKARHFAGTPPCFVMVP